MWNEILFGAVGSIVATVVVLLTREAFYKVRNLLPAMALFSGVIGSEKPCLVFVLRMTDLEHRGRFQTPLPRYAIASDQATEENRQNIPFVVSSSETQCVAYISNVLGRAGKSRDLELAYVDEEFDRWDAPMFILGGSWKATRAFETCDPYFRFQETRFLLGPTGEFYQPQTADHDLGLLQKMINPSTGLPVWVVMGLRGAGSVLASYALARWWRELGQLYGKRRFGVLLEMNDRDGWQQCRIRRLYPKVPLYKKAFHPIAWGTLSRILANAEE